MTGKKRGCRRAAIEVLVPNEKGTTFCARLACFDLPARQLGERGLPLIRPQRAIVHMGLHKTGSTFVQAFLSTHSATLRERGVYYAPDPGFAAQHRQAWQLLRGDLTGLAALVERAAGDGCETILLSSEDLEGLLRYPELASAAQGELKRLGIENLEWHIVLRSPGEVFASLYSEMSKHIFVEPYQVLETAMRAGSIYFDSPSPDFDVPFWFFVFDQSRFVGEFTRQVGGGVFVYDFSEPGPYPGWQISSRIDALDLDWKAIPEGWKNVRQPPDSVYRQTLQRYLDVMGGQRTSVTELFLGLEQHLAFSLPHMKTMASLVDERFGASHLSAIGKLKDRESAT